MAVTHGLRHFSTARLAFPGVSLLQLSGELDIASASECARGLRQVDVDADQAQPVLVDLLSLQYFDSAGLAVLVAFHERCERDGRPLAVACRRAGPVARLLSFAAASWRVPTFPSRGAALAALTARAT